MRKIFLITILALLACFTQAQYVRSVNPGSTTLESNFAIHNIGGTDTSFKFKMFEGCDEYAIYIVQTDTIEPSDTIAVRLYGSFDNANWFPVGDTISLDSANYPKADYWSGTKFTFPIGKVMLDKGSVTTDGNINVIFYYQK